MKEQRCHQSVDSEGLTRHAVVVGLQILFRRRVPDCYCNGAIEGHAEMATVASSTLLAVNRLFLTSPTI